MKWECVVNAQQRAAITVRMNWLRDGGIYHFLHPWDDYPMD